MLFFNIEKLQEEFIRLDAQTTLISDAKKKKKLAEALLFTRLRW
jgi:hypothetical protein